MCHLMMGICSEKCIIRWFGGHADSRERTDTNLEGTAQYTPSLCGTACRSQTTNLYSTLLFQTRLDEAQEKMIQ